MQEYKPEGHLQKPFCISKKLKKKPCGLQLFSDNMGRPDFHFRCFQPAYNGIQYKYSFNGGYIYIKMIKLEQIISQ